MDAETTKRFAELAQRLAAEGTAAQIEHELRMAFLRGRTEQMAALLAQEAA